MQDPDDFSWLKQGSTSPADLANSYDEWAATYDETLAGWDYRSPADTARLLRAETASDATILDAGCGTGLVGTALRAAGFTGPIDGFDISTSSLEQAARLNIYRKLKRVDLQTLPVALAVNSYDALVCIGVLTYVPDSAAVLREFARLVRPGGTVLVTQREDMFQERAFAETVKGLAEAGTFGKTVISEPQPYLPDNPDFGTDIEVIYAAMTVS
ncbi:MAG: class I SAM-dependent methyltransferase [Alphaproteobacteria bacterium]|jgi:predicted TPR repeat methyltransferase|nr:class I SAM-dependent methyltransferase [Alphaproteobacteria bacterium]MDP6812564.1 class I SAM-dependent methyltransferase [Alphaproteobacteria bacterium]